MWRSRLLTSQESKQSPFGYVGAHSEIVHLNTNIEIKVSTVYFCGKQLLIGPMSCFQFECTAGSLLCYSLCLQHVAK